jgi:hypothetical protein
MRRRRDSALCFSLPDWRTTAKSYCEAGTLGRSRRPPVAVESPIATDERDSLAAWR